ASPTTGKSFASTTIGASVFPLTMATHPASPEGAGRTSQPGTASAAARCAPGRNTAIPRMTSAKGHGRLERILFVPDGLGKAVSTGLPTSALSKVPFSKYMLILRPYATRQNNRPSILQ